MKQRILVTITAATIALLALGASASADSGKTVTTLRVNSGAVAAQPGSFALSATLVTADSKPVGSVKLDFYVTADLLGERDMYIGSSVTDGQGKAAVKYTPTWNGETKVTVKFADTDLLAGTQGTTSFTATGAVGAYQQEKPPLADFAAKVPYAVAVVVLGVWFLIAFALLGTARSILITRKGS